MRLTAMLLAGLSLAFSALPACAAKPAIWFCPLDPLIRGVGYGGAPGYMDLFTPNAPWADAAARVNVFKIYPQWIRAATDADLRTQFADLKRRHIALALEYGALTASGDCGKGVEGYGGQGLLKAAQRIRDDGGELRFIAMDEPIFFGTVYAGRNACRASVEDVVQNAAVNIKALWSEFPGVQIGDIEPVVGTTAQGLTDDQLVERYRDGIDAFARVLGKPLAFFDADQDWRSPGVLSRLAAMRDMVHSRNLPFGIIYNGDGRDDDDASWMQSARRNMARCEAALGSPDIVIFQSWNPNPRKLLPETDRDGFTSLINEYFGNPTRLSASLGRGEIAGRLVDQRGKPVSQAKIGVTLYSRSSPGKLATYTATGGIPKGALMAVLGIRVNMEGADPGDCNVTATEMRFEADGQEPVVRTFASPSDADPWVGLGATATGASALIENGVLRLNIDKSKTLMLNSVPVPVTSTGAYRFQVRATIPSSCARTGYFALIFLGDKKEVKRITIPFDVPDIPIPSATTGADGRWRALLPSSESYIAQCQYLGDAKHWPSDVEVSGP
ncbi:MAG: hypothetical protein P4L33_02960 [Capsulimonadaceae bacterium]|nr:hypothetical protein [Capsulimonadaceae bacterium]